MVKPNGTWEFIKAVGLFFATKVIIDQGLKLLSKEEECRRIGEPPRDNRPKLRVVK